MKSIVDGLGIEFVDMWECGLLCSKEHPWLGTSLDGWLVFQEKADGDNHNMKAGIEIKTLTGNDTRRTAKFGRELHGVFSRCKFGDNKFKQLVFKKEHRAQVLHHAVTCKFGHMVFIVADKTKVICVKTIAGLDMWHDSFCIHVHSAFTIMKIGIVH